MMGPANLTEKKQEYTTAQTHIPTETLSSHKQRMRAYCCSNNITSLSFTKEQIEEGQRILAEKWCMLN